MKNAFLVPVLMMLTLNATTFAQTPEKILGVYDSCGYCGRNDNYYSACTIDRDGTVKVERHRTRNGVKSEFSDTYRLSAKLVEKLLAKIEASRKADTVGSAKTYSGDAPTFSVTAYPESDLEFDVALYSDGKEVRDAPEARQLARQAARLCGMGGKRFLWSHVLSKFEM